MEFVEISFFTTNGERRMTGDTCDAAYSHKTKLFGQYRSLEMRIAFLEPLMRSVVSLIRADTTVPNLVIIVRTRVAAELGLISVLENWMWPDHLSEI